MNIETILETPVGEEQNPMIPQAIAFFHTMLDTIANATQLAKDVKELSSEVARLRSEVEEVHTRNMTLNDQINTVRAERDDFAAKYAQSQSDLALARDDRDYHRVRADDLDLTLANDRERHRVMMETLVREKDSSIESWRAEHEALKGAHADVLVERDALAKELAETQSRFQAIEKKLWDVVGGLSKPEPVAQPEPQPQPVEEWRSASGY